jgi:hypothetical protein
MDLIRNGAAVALAVTGAVAAYYVASSTKSSKGSSLRDLPGPKRSFLIGNMKNFPRKAWTDTFTKWWDEMGECSLPPWFRPCQVVGFQMWFIHHYYEC